MGDEVLRIPNTLRWGWVLYRSTEMGWWELLHCLTQVDVGWPKDACQ